MIPGLPNPWIILGFVGALLASTLGGYFYGAHHESLAWEASTNKLKAEAQRTLTKATEAVRVKEQTDADNAREIDAIHAKDLAVAFADRDAFAVKLRLARRGNSCPNTPSIETPNPSVNTGTPEVGNVGLGQSDSVDPGLQARDGVKELVAYATACHSWAVSVGR